MMMRRFQVLALLLLTSAVLGTSSDVQASIKKDSQDSIAEANAAVAVAAVAAAAQVRARTAIQHAEAQAALATKEMMQAQAEEKAIKAERAMEAKKMAQIVAEARSQERAAAVAKAEAMKAGQQARAQEQFASKQEAIAATRAKEASDAKLQAVREMTAATSAERAVKAQDAEAARKESGIMAVAKKQMASAAKNMQQAWVAGQAAREETMRDKAKMATMKAALMIAAAVCLAAHILGCYAFSRRRSGAVQKGALSHPLIGDVEKGEQQDVSEKLEYMRKADQLEQDLLSTETRARADVAKAEAQEKIAQEALAAAQAELQDLRSSMDERQQQQQEQASEKDAALKRLHEQLEQTAAQVAEAKQRAAHAEEHAHELDALKKAELEATSKIRQLEDELSKAKAEVQAADKDAALKRLHEQLEQTAARAIEANNKAAHAEELARELDTLKEAQLAATSKIKQLEDELWKAKAEVKVSGKDAMRTTQLVSTSKVRELANQFSKANAEASTPVKTTAVRNPPSSMQQPVVLHSDSTGEQGNSGINFRRNYYLTRLA